MIMLLKAMQTHLSKEYIITNNTSLRYIKNNEFKVYSSYVKQLCIQISEGHTIIPRH